jgi:DNA-binding response OmpR family regulator
MVTGGGSNQWRYPSMKGKSVLIVDDEKTILGCLSKDLKCAGLVVTTAASGEEAIAHLHNRCFDLVITDLAMPGVDGFQVLKAAKQQCMQTLIIILTGYGAMESVLDALRLGADDFLQKPCDTDELLYRISNCLAKQEMARKITFYETILKVCSYCKKIQDDRHGDNGKGNWYNPEEYFKRTKDLRISHGCCPDCYAKQLKTLHAE